MRLRSGWQSIALKKATAESIVQQISTGVSMGMWNMVGTKYCTMRVFIIAARRKIVQFWRPLSWSIFSQAILVSAYSSPREGVRGSVTEMYGDLRRSP